MSLQAAATFLSEGVHHLAHALLRFISENDFDWILSSGIVRIFKIGIFVIAIALLAFHPILNIVLRPPLLKYLGMKFGGVRISIIQLSLSITGIELLSSESKTLRAIFVAIFPSAHVKKLKKSFEYPESKVSVDHLVVKVRIGTVAGNQDSDARISPSDSNEDSSTPDENENSVKTSLLEHIMYFLVPRPIVVVEVDGLNIEIEKAYLAPAPPTQFSNGLDPLPSAIVSHSHHDLPTFDQDIFMDSLINDELAESMKVTQCIERWINHVQTKLKKKVTTPKDGSKVSFSSNVGIKSDEVSSDDNVPAETKSYDERFNAIINAVTTIFCHSLSIHLSNVSVVVSGAGSTFVKETRDKCNMREANLIIAMLPRQKRALTIVAAETISISFSPDTQCNAVICCVGLHAKVGDPIPNATKRTEIVAERDDCREDSTGDDAYTWHTIAHPFHLVAEFIGVLPFFVWAVNYDHVWQTRNLAVHLSVTEIAVTLSPEHLHTALLHLDDFTDINSPWKEWIDWLNNQLLQTKMINENEKRTYVHNFARIKGETLVDGAEKEQVLTASQMKDMEKRMSRYEIVALRCKAMKKKWKIPKENDEFSLFLRGSRSRIREKNDSSPVTPPGVSSPFNIVYSSPLDALAALVRAKAAIFAPPLSIKIQVNILHIDFPCSSEEIQDEISRKKSTARSVSSSITVSGVSFGLKLTNPLFSMKPGFQNFSEPRKFVNLSLQLREIEWGVADANADNALPKFRNNEPVGMIYKHHGGISTDQVLAIGLNISVSPTQEMDPHLFLTSRLRNLVIIANPLPFLSSIQTLVALSDLPFRTFDEANSTAHETEDIVEEFQSEDDSVSPQVSDDSLPNLNVKAVLAVENISIIFMIDRKTVSRGMLELKVGGIKMKLETSRMTGYLVVLPDTLLLCSGQISFHQPYLDTGRIDWKVMPFKPIVKIEGARFRTSVGETHANTKNNVLLSTLKTIGLDVKVGAESFVFNASPSMVVAILGVINSLDPFWGGSSEDRKAAEAEYAKLARQKKIKEEQAKLQFQRDALLRIFQTVDVDGSGTLQEEELQTVVLKLFDQNSSSEDGASNMSDACQKLTTAEIKRERDYFINIIDPNRTDEVSFAEVDAFLFKIANKIDDSNLIPEIEVTGVPYLKDFSKSNDFLSGTMLRKLVYFEDLREYTAMHEVYRLTGHVVIGSSSTFPAPSLWRQGQGVELFWQLYTSETGCTRHSLNGQDIAAVQRKLVRTLCNYNFAKFCWKTLVVEQLNDAYGSGGNTFENVLSRWVLDKDSRSSIDSGVINRFLMHVDNLSKINRESQEKRMGRPDLQFQFQLSVVAVIDSAVFGFGSAHTFTDPLVEIRFSSVNLSASALLSQSGWFVPERATTCPSPVKNNRPERDAQVECEGGNEFNFRSTFSVMYLNTRHDYMECFVEPYTCFGGANYKVLRQDPRINDGESNEAASCSINVHCPRMFNMNASPTFFETAAILTKIVSESDQHTYRMSVQNRDIGFVRNFWDASAVNGGSRMAGHGSSMLFNREETKRIVRAAADVHWIDEMKGLSEKKIDDVMLAFVNMADKDGDDVISSSDLESAIRAHTSRSDFSGCKEIQIENNIGRALHVSTKGNQGIYHSLQSQLSERNLNSFQVIHAGNSAAIPLKEDGSKNKSRLQTLMGKLSFYTKGYKTIDDVAVSPYQAVMFSLKRRRQSQGRRRGKRRTHNASGFTPYLVVVPKSARLDSISLHVRSCVTIRTEIPVNIRIVRLSSLGYLSKRGTKSTIDLTKKNLSAGLKRLVEGALIVYQKNGVSESKEKKYFSNPLPLDVLMSSRYHALLVQDITKKGDNNAWRDPVLLTKDFLFNTMHITEVTRCHAISGIVVQKERRDVQVTNKHYDKNIATDTKKSVSRRTAWDTTIMIVPFFLLSNAMPFPIVVRTWQLSENDEGDLWNDPASLEPSIDNDEDHSSSDDDISVSTLSVNGKKSISEQFHFSTGTGHNDYYSTDNVERGGTLRLSGINVRQPLFMQVSQCVTTPIISTDAFMWSNPMLMHLEKLRTGVNKKGSLSLPKVILDIGDNCDALVDVSIEGRIRMPMCTIYSPYWIMNKTGMKMEYKISGESKKYVDSGSGGLPIMVHCGKSGETNTTYQKTSREISVCPLERPTISVAKAWWDASSNGELVLMKNAINHKGRHLVGWSEKIELDAAGTFGEVHCNHYIINSSIESLAGAFHQSNLVTFSPRFIVKNMLHISISILPFSGLLNDSIHKANQLTKNLTERDKSALLNLAPNESTIIYKFNEISYSQGIEKPYRWVAFCVNASRFNESGSKWHVIAVDHIASTCFGEHDGISDTMCGIIEAKVHSSDGGSTVVSIAHAPVPPFQIENRSSTHYLQFVQDDDDAVVFELPPMYSCGYTWDSPFGKKRLRVVVIPKAQSRSHQVENAIKQERAQAKASEEDGGNDESDCEKTVDCSSSDDESVNNDMATEPLLRSLKKGLPTNGNNARKLNRTSSFRSRRRKLFSMNSRSYSMGKVGRKKDLPCPDMQSLDQGNTLDSVKMSSKLFAHIRILAGTKIISFNDSPWLAEQVELGRLRKGGDFKSALCDINVDGVGFYLMDEYPRELIGVVVRDIRLHKPRGSIEASVRVRHFQIDSMLPTARYPIIIQPLPLGVDRRDDQIQDRNPINIPGSVNKQDCFWLKDDEKPVPVFEVTCSYVPQNNMIWVPSVDVCISPMKLQLDIDYLLRIVGMVINSVSKYYGYIAEDHVATSHANNKLQYITRSQMSACLTYIEKLNIAPVWFEIEMNIKADDRDQTSGDSVAEESDLTLNTIARSTNSTTAAGILSWIINVGANFAHVSPSFNYKGVTYTDRYCDIVDLIFELAFSYVIQTIKQSYKVIFSMHLLGDPKLLAHQYKTGIEDLVFKTRDEVLAGGKDGVGKGVTSFVHNVVGGTFFAFGKASGGIADTLDSVATNEMTSNHLKPKSASEEKPEHAGDGVVQGAEFLGKTVVHGVAGLIGNPYRGAMTGTVSGFAKGVASGATGLLVAPFVGALGFVAKTTDGLGATTKMLDLGVIEARCRPARMVPWGRPMSENGLSYLKAIGIRIHTIRYQKRRMRIVRKSPDDTSEHNPNEWETSKEYKRARAAEERRKSPPSKAVSIIHNKEKQHFLTSAIKPKLLTDHLGNLVLSHYAVTFEESIILRSSDLQLHDEVAINFWNTKIIKTATTKSKPLAVCKLTVGDIHSSILNFHKEQLARKELDLSEGIGDTSHKLFDDDAKGPNAAENKSIIIPTPQEYSLFRPVKESKSNRGNIFDAIGEEMESIQKAEEDALKAFDSDSSESDSDSSFLGDGEKEKVESMSSIVKSNERLYGSVSLSFFPVPW